MRAYDQLLGTLAPLGAKPLLGNHARCRAGVGKREAVLAACAPGLGWLLLTDDGAWVTPWSTVYACIDGCASRGERGVEALAASFGWPRAS